ncbi:MAG: CotH kinase family protein [Nannocystaceae bacterium]
MGGRRAANSWVIAGALASAPIGCGDDAPVGGDTATTTGGATTEASTTEASTSEASTTEATSTTTSATSTTTTGETAGSTTAPAPICGDGVLDPGEACDDGNDEDRDGCSNACMTGYVPDPVTMGVDLPPVIPVLVIEVGGAMIQKDVEVPGTITIYEDHDGTLMDLGAVKPTMVAPIGFEGRGNFTWTLPKKGYAFELQDGVGGSLDREILGLPAGSDYALYACYTDKTCMRNALVFALGQELGRWSPRTRFVELVLDGEYMGLYMVWERVRRDKTRCDVDKPAATAKDGDLSGGYIFRHEGGGKGQETIDGVTYDRDWSTTAGRVYTYHYPQENKLSADQSAYLRGFVQDFEDALAQDPAAYSTWIDVLSWVDHAIVEELTNNWDGYVHSVYMTKESVDDGGRFRMGPLWDYDLAFANGNVTGYNCATDNWAVQIVRPYPDDVPTYWLDLFADAEFRAALKCRWQELRAGPITSERFAAQIAAWTAFTADARARDQARWQTMGKPIFPNCWNEATYEAEIDHLQLWIDDRIAWLDGQLAAVPGACR